eukprot:276336_1
MSMHNANSVANEGSCNKAQKGYYPWNTAFHGTYVSMNELREIITDKFEQCKSGFWVSECGLQPSKHGRIGCGIYLSPNLNVAEAISEYRQTQRPDSNKAKVVLEYYIFLPNTAKYKICRCNPLQIGVTEPGHCQMELGIDAVKAWHPPWCGASVLPEICVANPKHLKLLRVYVRESFAFKPYHFISLEKKGKFSIDTKGNITWSAMKHYYKPIAFDEKRHDQWVKCLKNSKAARGKV